MAEHIERTAAVKTVLRMRRPENSVAQNRMLSIIQMDISKLPAADVDPVVRCKNCRSYNKPKTGWCEVHLDCEHPDDFCSYGERKESADNG